MRFKCLACNALETPVSSLAAQSPHVVEIEFIEIGWHDNPVKLRQLLQSSIDCAYQYDAILLAYGLCGLATAGLIARHAPLIIPKAHDCITLYLGSRKRYQEQFQMCSGTYWYSQDYIKHRQTSKSTYSLGCGTDKELQSVHEEFVRKYGKDNADYLLETMSVWQSHYKRAIFVDFELPGSKEAMAIASEEAARRRWLFDRITGDLILIKRLLNGDWEDDFLVVSPGQRVKVSTSDQVIRVDSSENA